MLIIIAFTTIAGCHFQNATKTTNPALNTIQHTIKQAQEETSRATTIRTPNTIPSDNKRGHAANSNPAKESTSRPCEANTRKKINKKREEKSSRNQWLEHFRIYK
jgi:type II secretory pathway pseudopilin PulG